MKFDIGAVFENRSRKFKFDYTLKITTGALRENIYIYIFIYIYVNMSLNFY